MFEIKLATRDDAVAISRMSAALIEYGLPRTWSPARVIHHIRRRDSAVLVARKEEQIFGFAVMEYADHSAHLNLLAVSTLARRQGIGRSLLTWLEQSAVTMGVFLISLELRASNSTALKFYSAMGYRQTGRLPNYYSGREDAISMTSDLAVGIPSSAAVAAMNSRLLRLLNRDSTP